MALRKSTQAANRAPAMTARGFSAGVILCAEYVVAAGLANTDIIEMVALPAGMIVEGVKLVGDDIDTANTVTADVGLMSGQYLAALDDAGAARTCGAEFFAAATTLQAGGVASSAVKVGHMLAPSLSDRSIGIKLTAGITPIVGAKVRLYVHALPAPVGIAFA